MKTWTITLKVSVADSWVADGFDMSERLEDLKEQVSNMLPFAYGHELIVESKISKAPSKEQIAALQSGECEIAD